MGLNVTAEDLALTKPIVFDAKEVVEFVCLDADENVQYQRLSLKCKVLSGQYRGRRYTISLSLKKENEIQRRRLATFALAFYNEKEITSGETPIARLVGRKFSAVAQPSREWSGKTYQDFDHFKDLGEAHESDVNAAISSEPHIAPDSDIPF